MKRTSRRHVRLLLSVLASAVFGALVIAQPTGAMAAVQPDGGAPSPTGCGGFNSDTTMPSTIRVLLTGTGQVISVPFETYVEDVLPNEWIPSWDAQSLEAGAVAVKTYGWYWANHGDFTAANGQCYNVDDTINYQVFKQNSELASTNAAVEATWSTIAHEGGQIFEASFQRSLAGGEDTCGEAVNGSILSQTGSQACAEAGETYSEILSRYYAGVQLTGSSTPPPSSGLASGVSAVVHGSAIDVFATDASGRLVERFYSGGQWSGWQQLGGTLASGPSAVVTSDGTVHVFAVNTDHELVQKWYTTAGQWSGWQSFTGTLVSGPTAVVASDGTLHVFAVGLSRQLVQRWYTTAGDWSGWQDLGGTLAGESPSAVVTSDHTIHVFATDTDGGLVQKWYTSAGDWSGWQSFTGTLISGSSAVVASDGTLHVFAVGLSRQLVQRWYTTAGDWSGWQDLSGTLAGESPSAVVTSDGTIHVFAVDTNHTLVQKWYTTAGDWSGWQNLGGTLS